MSGFYFLARVSGLDEYHAVGRPWVYGAVIAGQAGVEQVIKHTLADLDVTLGLAGYHSLSDIQGKGDAVLTKVDL